MTRKYTENYYYEVKDWGTRNVLEKWVKIQQKQKQPSMADNRSSAPVAEDEATDSDCEDSDDTEEVRYCPLLSEFQVNFDVRQCDDYKLFLTKLTHVAKDGHAVVRRDYFPRIRFNTFYRYPLRSLSHLITSHLIHLSLSSFDLVVIKSSCLERGITRKF